MADFQPSCAHDHQPHHHVPRLRWRLRIARRRPLRPVRRQWLAVDRPPRARPVGQRDPRTARGCMDDPAKFAPMKAYKHFSGERIGIIVLLERLPRTKTRPYLWLARCDCGNECRVIPSDLKSGKVKSCGCFIKEDRHRRITHGASRVGNWTPEYNSWKSIKQRCLNPKSKSYRFYGARGISMCKRWEASFASFLEDMGPKPDPSYSIDRVDNSKGYYRDNCRWASRLIQNRNRRGAHKILFQGRIMTLREVADALRMDASTIRQRAQRYGISCQESVQFYEWRINEKQELRR